MMKMFKDGSDYDYWRWDLTPLSPLLTMLSMPLRAEYHLAQVKEKHAQLHKALKKEKTMEKQFGKYKKPQGTEPNDLFGW